MDRIIFKLENCSFMILDCYSNAFACALQFMTMPEASFLKSIAHDLDQVAKKANRLWKGLKGDWKAPYEKEEAVVPEGEQTREWAIDCARGDLLFLLSEVGHKVSVLVNCIKTELFKQGKGKERDDACIAASARWARRSASFLSANLLVYAEALETKGETK